MAEEIKWNFTSSDRALMGTSKRSKTEVDHRFTRRNFASQRGPGFAEVIIEDRSAIRLRDSSEARIISDAVNTRRRGKGSALPANP